MAFELLLERRERAIACRGQLLDRYIGEDMRVDYLLEIIPLPIHITQHLALEATVGLRDYEVNQLGHVDIFGRLVVHKVVVVKIARRMSK